MNAPVHHRVVIFKALAHPVRLQILELLANGPLTVSEITAQTAVTISSISKHLTQMRRAGILAVDRKGLFQHYRIACDCFTELLECADHVMVKKLGKAKAKAAPVS